MLRILTNCPTYSCNKCVTLHPCSMSHNLFKTGSSLPVLNHIKSTHAYIKIAKSFDLPYCPTWYSLINLVQSCTNFVKPNHVQTSTAFYNDVQPSTTMYSLTMNNCLRKRWFSVWKWNMAHSGQWPVASYGRLPWKYLLLFYIY